MGEYHGNGRGIKVATESVIRELLTSTASPTNMISVTAGINKSANLESARRMEAIPRDTLSGASLEQIVIPSTVVGALLLILIAALGIVLTLRRHRRRGVIYHNHEIEHLHIVRKAPRAQLESAGDLDRGYPLTEIRD